MPKKSKKQKQRSAYRSITRPAASPEVSAEQQTLATQYGKTAPVIAQQPRFTKKAVSNLADQETQYRFIGAELLRIMILAGSAIVILIIISFIIK